MLQAWIEGVVGKEFEHPFADELRSGEVLCQLINAIAPGSVKKVNQSSFAFKQMEVICLRCGPNCVRKEARSSKPTNYPPADTPPKHSHPPPPPRTRVRAEYYELPPRGSVVRCAAKLHLRHGRPLQSGWLRFNQIFLTRPLRSSFHIQKFTPLISPPRSPPPQGQHVRCATDHPGVEQGGHQEGLSIVEQASDDPDGGRLSRPPLSAV